VIHLHQLQTQLSDGTQAARYNKMQTPLAQVTSTLHAVQCKASAAGIITTECSATPHTDNTPCNTVQFSIHAAQHTMQ